MSSETPGRPYGVLRPGDGPWVVLTSDGVEVARWPLGAAGADLDVVDELSRMQLAVRRLGCSIRVDAVGDELGCLLELAGLDDVLGVAPRSVQVQRHPEGLEQVGVEEVVMPDDPSA